MKPPNFFDKSFHLLSAEAGEVGGDVVPGLEGVTAELEMRRHTRPRLFHTDEVVAVEQIATDRKDGMIARRHVDIFIQPLVQSLDRKSVV